MRPPIRIGGMALALCAGVAVAAAQTSPPADRPMQQQSTPSTDLPKQPPEQEADNAKPTTLRPEHSATADRVPETVPGASAQTVPSTISAENAAIDDLPIIAMQLPLTAEQKQKIAASLGKTTATAAATVSAGITQSLPSTVALEEFPAEAKAAVPEVERYKYVRLPDRVLIVDPPFWIVVGEIKQ